MTIRADAPTAFLREAASLVLVAPLFVWWAVADGGYPAGTWLFGVPYLAAAAAILALHAPRPPLTGARLAAALAIAALAGWTALSVLWADDRGSAWLGAERTLLYALAFLLPLVWPPSARGIVWALGLWVASAGAGLAVGLIAAGGETGALAETGRLVPPTGYVNATAALCAMGALPALVLAADPERRRSLRAAALGSAAFLAGGLALTQSRGAVAAAAAGIAVAFLLTPHRIRLAVSTAIVAGAITILLQPLLEVRRVALAGDADDALRSAWVILLALAAAGAAAAAVLEMIERARPPSPALARRAGRLGRVGVAAAALVAAAVFAIAVGDPIGWASERYRDFKVADYDRLEQSDSRFTGDLGSNRYEYWRVATDVFLDKPLLGAGGVNFAAPYLERRRVDKSTLYAHSVWFQTLSDLGAIGFAALAAFAVAAAVSVRAALRRCIAYDRAVRVAAVAPLVYFGVHSSADWVSFFPGLAVPALALAGAAAGGGPAARPAVVARRRRPARIAAVVALAVVAVTALPPLVAARITDRAQRDWRADPESALADLRRAEDVNPLSARPPLVRGIIALEIGAAGEARAAFGEVARRDPSAWYPPLALGMLAAADGQRADARRYLALAAARNPRAPGIARFQRQLDSGGKFDPVAIQRAILSEDD